MDREVLMGQAVPMWSGTSTSLGRVHEAGEGGHAPAADSDVRTSECGGQQAAPRDCAVTARHWLGSSAPE